MRRQITRIYQLKIALRQIRPQIWRRVLVPADIELDALHAVIQLTMGWTDSHLHSFDFGDRQFTTPYDDNALEELQMEDENSVHLSELIDEPKSVFEYTYDFGDDWVHAVTLEKILPPSADTEYPVCLAGKRACPPDDCGGAWGYVNLLEALRDPAHPEHKELKSWVGRKFDSELFDLEKVNKALKRIRRWV